MSESLDEDIKDYNEAIRLNPKKIYLRGRAKIQRNIIIEEKKPEKISVPGLQSSKEKLIDKQSVGFKQALLKLI